jgi:signal transduction histidine kinase
MTGFSFPLSAAAIRRRLPRGRALAGFDFEARHRLLCAVLAVQLPILLLVGVAGPRLWVQTFLALAGVGVLLACGYRPGSRRRRSTGISLGLLIFSASLVHLTPGWPQLRVSYFVALALIGLYQDWVVYAVAYVAAVLGYGILGVIGPDAIDTMPDSHRLPAMLINIGFITAMCASQVVFWYYQEQLRLREEHYRGKLYDGRDSLVARLEETDRLRSDLLGTVSHEFRTPITAIRASTLTLRRRRDRLSTPQVDELLEATLTQTDRLSHLLENMLTAAGVVLPDETAVAEPGPVIADVMRLLNSDAQARIRVDLPGSLPARIAPRALQQIVYNLLDNAVRHSWPDTPVGVEGFRNGASIVLTFENSGQSLDSATVERMFEPFTQADTSATRTHGGAGMGLHVVHRLVEVHHGTMRMSAADGTVRVEVSLPAASIHRDRDPARTHAGRPNS